MNSVAGQLVATMMNSGFNALKSTGQTISRQGSDTKDFSNVLEKVNQSQSAEERKSLRAEGPKGQKAEVHTGDKAETAKVVEEAVQEVNDEVVSEVSKTASSEVTGEMEDVTESSVTELQVTELDLAQVFENVLTVVSELMHISVEELEAMMDEHGITLADFADQGKVLETVQELFGYDTVAQLLLDSDATQMLKDISESMTHLLKELDIDPETFKELEEQMVMNGSETAVQAEVKTTEVVELPAAQDQTQDLKASTDLETSKFEVHDLRQEAKTTEYGQNQQHGQDQGQPTFGQFMSEHIAADKVNFIPSEGRSLYQQAVTSQVIDQIVSKAVVELTDAKSTMQMQLNPEHLGKVAVSVVAEQGSVKGQFIAENQVVKQMLESNMAQLKTQLEEQGIKVDKIEVTIGNANQYFNQKDQSEQQQQAQKKNSRNRIGRIRRMMQMEETEITAVTESKPQGVNTTMDVHTVEFSA